MAPRLDDRRRSSRAARYSIAKHSRGLCKKAAELSTLCGTDVCFICYTPDSAVPIVWPPDRAKADSIVDRFLDVPAGSYKAPKNQITFVGKSNIGGCGGGEGEEEKTGEIKKGKEKAPMSNGSAPPSARSVSCDRLRLQSERSALASLVEALDSSLAEVRDRMRTLQLAAKMVHAYAEALSFKLAEDKTY